MKRILTIFITLLSILIISCGEKNTSNVDGANTNANNMDHSAHSGHTAHQTGSGIIDLMHQPMMGKPFEKTANIDVDFLVNMIPHHQGAILSSKKLLETTTNQALIDLANNIISAQEKEVEEFSLLIDELKAKNTSYADINTEAFGNEMQILMNKMMDEMASIKVTENDDINFLKGMIPHHQGAIDVSRKILEATKYEKIKEIAYRIITAQEKEINDMNNMLNTIK